MKHQINAAWRLSIVACLTIGLEAPCMAEAAHAADMPPLLRPVTLRDDDGNAEVGLVDPFSRRDADGAEASPAGEDGLTRTTMGEISSEFRILAITIPSDTNTPRSALLQFYTADEPILVHEGDLVRVDRTGSGQSRGARAGKSRRSAARVSAARGRRSAQRPGGLADIDLEEQLKKYVFYLNVKNIEPTFIEVYHNKKRPDETIRLNW